jgi:hypothetical protein
MTRDLRKVFHNNIQCFKDVTSYTTLETPDFSWSIESETQGLLPDKLSSRPIYFILDSQNHNAFSHWVFESFVWIRFFQTLQKDYPNIFLVLEEYKDYKKLFIRQYGVSLDRVCLHSEIKSQNYCFFHTYTSLNDLSIPPIYYENVALFKQSLERPPFEKDIPLLYLPRGTKENLQGTNNRMYNIQNELKDFVRIMGGTVYETDKTTSLEEQIQIVKRSSLILLDYGSNLWVNGFFANNSKILCLNIGWQHHYQFPSLAFTWNLIHQTNGVTQVFAYPSEQTGESNVPLVCFHLPHVLSQLQRLLDISRDTQ